MCQTPSGESPVVGVEPIARQRLANLLGWIREVEQAHVLDVLTGEAAPKPLRQVRSQPFNERSPVLGPFLPRLLELDDAMPNQPIGGGHGGVHRTGGRVSGRVDDLRHVSKDGLVGGVVPVECPFARREQRRRVLGAPAQADVDWKRFQVHQTSASMWSPARSASGGESVAGAACLSLAACSSSRVKRRRSRSSASGAGLEKTLTTPNSEASSTGLLRLSCLPLPFISLYLVGPAAGRI